MITINCLLFVVGIGKQTLPFEFTSAEASKFMAGYGYFKGYSKAELEHRACQDLNYTLGFFDDEEN